MIALSRSVPVARLPLVSFAAPLTYSMPRPAAAAFNQRDRVPMTVRTGRTAVFHDPLQFASVRALHLDRGRYRASPIDAKLEFRMSGDTSSLDIAGGVPRIVRKALD